MVDHVERRPGLRLRGHREDAHDDEAEVRDGREGDQPLDVLLTDRQQRPVDDPDQRQHQDRRGEGPGGVREQVEAVAQHREGADLVDHRRDQHRHARGGLAHGVRQPGVQRPERGLHREGEHEAEEQRVLGDRREVQLAAGQRPGDGRQVEGAVAAGADALLGGDHVEPDHRGQHDQSAEQVVEQELDGRVGALLGVLALGAVAEAADEEVHRDEHGLEEHVEQEDVGGLEGEHHHRLDRQDQGEEALGPAAALEGAGVVGDRVGVVPGGQHHEGHQDRGEQDQHHRDAVDAQAVADAEVGDPRVRLGELVVRPAGGEADRDDDGQCQRRQRERQRDDLVEVASPGIGGGR